MKQKNGFFLLLASAVILFSASLSPVSAADVRSLNLQEITTKADRIFEGTCTSVRVERDKSSGLIYTVYTYAVEDWIKGTNGKEIEVRQYGGILPDGTGIVVGGMPRHAPGEKAILFLHKPSRSGLTSPVGLGQGKFRVVKEPGTAEERVINNVRNTQLFRGMDLEKLVRRDAKGNVVAEDKALVHAAQGGAKGARSEDFKALVRRLVETQASSDTGAAKSPAAPERIRRMEVTR